MIECGLDPAIRKCPYWTEKMCMYTEKCSFQNEVILKEKVTRKAYKREERWYEKYTMGRK